MAKVIKLQSYPTTDVDLDGIRFTLRGLSREEVYEYIIKRREEFENLSDNELADAVREFEDTLLDLAVITANPEDKPMVIDKIRKSAYETYQKIIQTIMDLSGVGERKK